MRWRRHVLLQLGPFASLLRRIEDVALSGLHLLADPDVLLQRGWDESPLADRTWFQFKFACWFGDDCGDCRRRKNKGIISITRN